MAQSGNNLQSSRYRQLDVAKKVRKSYELFAMKERRRDCSESIPDKTQYDRASLELRGKKESFGKQQASTRFLSVGFAAPCANNGFSKENTRSSRDCSRREKTDSADGDEFDQRNDTDKTGYSLAAFPGDEASWHTKITSDQQTTQLSSCAPGDMK